VDIFCLVNNEKVMKKYTVTQYAGCKRPNTNFTVLVNDVLRLIKHGEKNLPSIMEARVLGKGNPKYDNIKQNKLPTFRFNFHYNGSACNKNITGPTGLIYLDVDDTLYIPESNYVFAKWKSLSNTGYGVLAKVDNLTPTNYSEVYNELSELIGVSTDTGARKASQQTVLSFDPNLFYNAESIVFHYLEKEEKPNRNVSLEKKQVIRIDPYNKSSTSLTSEDSLAYEYLEEEKVAHLSILRKEKESITRKATFSDNYSSDVIRFNNINDYFVDETPYIVFKEKIRICSPFFPSNIKEGTRNTILFFYLTQIAILNPKTGITFLKSIARSVCMNMLSKLKEPEIDSIVHSVLRMRKEDTLELYLNEERRILFNPAVKISFKDKMAIVNSELGTLKKERTMAAIYNILEDWDFKSDGKITQKKVRDKLGCHISTIGRHWDGFKDYVGGLNASRPL
jgi:hypothetical protein